MESDTFYEGFIVKLEWRLSGIFMEITCRVATNLENSGNLKNCQNLRKNSGKFELLQKRPENSGEMKNMIANKNALIEFFSLELLREKFKMSSKTRGNSKNLNFCRKKLETRG